MGEDREKKRKRQREWKNARRREWIVEKGNRCAKCGVQGYANLEVDHIDPIDKCYNPTDVWSMKKERREEELSKCQVLCVDCHEEKHPGVGVFRGRKLR